MSWEQIIGDALSGVSNFAYTLIDIILGPINPVALEGLMSLLILGVALKLINNAPKIPKKVIKIIKDRKQRDEDEYE